MAEESAWNRTVLRVNNERLLLGRLRADGATSRAELARITGLSKPTVSTALGRLERAGLVREVGKVANAGRGRSPRFPGGHHWTAVGLAFCAIATVGTASAQGIWDDPADLLENLDKALAAVG